jgi:hypothetical protein
MSFLTLYSFDVLSRDGRTLVCLASESTETGLILSPELMVDNENNGFWEECFSESEM